jgi:dCTP deaminase
MVFKDFRPGVLCKNQLKYLAKKNIILNSNMDEEAESAFDLHLGNKYWEMKGSIKGIHKSSPYIQILENRTFCTGPLKLSGKLELKKRKTYIFEIAERLEFPSNINKRLCCRSTGKSSIGRLDVLTRLITDNSQAYDVVPEDNPGALYLEVTPITFNVVVEPGLTLNQLRIYYGDLALNEIKPEQIKKNLWGTVIVNNDGAVMPEDIDYLTLNLDPVEFGNNRDKFIAFKAKNNETPIDLTSNVKVNPELFWEGIKPNTFNCIPIKKDEFYILRSKERFKLPKDIAVYCQAVSEELGEIRIHYAGFAHPGFGLFRDNDKKGAPLIFEVRGHTLNTFLRNGERLAIIKYYRMSATESIKKPSYTDQELKLSKYFEDWR